MSCPVLRGPAFLCPGLQIEIIACTRAVFAGKWEAGADSNSDDIRSCTAIGSDYVY
jgi:hypothetical protein